MREEEAEKWLLCLGNYKPKSNIFQTNEDMLVLDTLPRDRLDPKFLEAAAKLRDFVLANGEVKKIDGKPLVGESFATLVKQLVEGVQEENLYIDNAFDCVIEASNQKALELALKEMHSFLKNGPEFPVSMDTCTTVLNAAKDAATRLYLSRAINPAKFGCFGKLTEAKLFVL